MEPRNLKQFSKTVSVAMFLCVATYTGTAAFGYLTFGDLITTDILLSYDPDPAVIIAVILIAVKTYTTYPILLFCGRYGFVLIYF
jgi:sodium-coupled neutral amino acid transporter 7/8